MGASRLGALGAELARQPPPAGMGPARGPGRGGPAGGGGCAAPGAADLLTGARAWRSDGQSSLSRSSNSATAPGTPAWGPPAPRGHGCRQPPCPPPPVAGPLLASPSADCPATLPPCSRREGTGPPFGPQVGAPAGQGLKWPGLSASRSPRRLAEGT